jgi:hypothetical protein
MSRPRFQFRLRTLFVVVTLSAIACGIVVEWQAFAERGQAAREEKARRLVSELGGEVLGVDGRGHYTAIALPLETRLDDRLCIAAGFPGVTLIAFRPGFGPFDFSRRRSDLMPFPDDPAPWRPIAPTSPTSWRPAKQSQDATDPARHW